MKSLQTIKAYYQLAGWPANSSNIRAASTCLLPSMEVRYLRHFQHSNQGSPTVGSQEAVLCGVGASGLPDMSNVIATGTNITVGNVSFTVYDLGQTYSLSAGWYAVVVRNLSATPTTQYGTYQLAAQVPPSDVQGYGFWSWDGGSNWEHLGFNAVAFSANNSAWFAPSPRRTDTPPSSAYQIYGGNYNAVRWRFLKPARIVCVYVGMMRTGTPSDTLSMQVVSGDGSQVLDTSPATYGAGVFNTSYSKYVAYPVSVEVQANQIVATKVYATNGGGDASNYYRPQNYMTCDGASFANNLCTSTYIGDHVRGSSWTVVEGTLDHALVYETLDQQAPSQQLDFRGGFRL